MRTLALLALLIVHAASARAEEPNLALASGNDPGAAAQLVLAHQAYQAALKSGDPVLLIAAIRLARTIKLRPPTGWTKTTAGDPLPDTPDGRLAAPDPSGPQALAIAQGLAGDDPDLQDLVYDLDAQLPHGRLPTAIDAAGSVDAGQTDVWRLVLAGQVTAELGLIGDGDTALGLTVRDSGGAVVCTLPAVTAPALCRFTPARNGFFTVEIGNRGQVRNSYRLIGN